VYYEENHRYGCDKNPVMDVTHLKYIESVWKINKPTIMALLLTFCFHIKKTV